MSESDFLRDIGPISFTTRLKRISDRMLQDGKRMYQELGLDIEPNWYVIFLILDEHDALSVTEIANKIQFSHPSVVSMVEKMTKKGFLDSDVSPEDSRKRIIRLSDKALQQLPQYKEIWKAGVEGLMTMLGNMDFFPMLDVIEDNLNQHGFKERTLTKLKNIQENNSK